MRCNGRVRRSRLRVLGTCLNTARRLVVPFALGILLTACGGGGGGSTPPPSSPPVVPPPASDPPPTDDEPGSEEEAEEEEGAENRPPEADAGRDRTVLVGATVLLDGSGSTDVDGDKLEYRWTLLSAPGPGIELTAADTIEPSFIAHFAGDYVIELVVNDGVLDSAADTVRISTSNTAPVADAGLD